MERAKRTVKTYIFDQVQEYRAIWDLQKKWVQEIDQGLRLPTLLLMEHLPVYTLGRGANEGHLLISEEDCLYKGIGLVRVDRGGDITYHGPGQLVGYPLIRLDFIQNNAQRYLRKIEESLLQTLAYFGIEATRKPPYTGVWVQEEKIAAIGVKFNRGPCSKSFISSHGFALNVSVDLDQFTNIIPCGIKEYGVTSLEKVLGKRVPIATVAEIYATKFYQEFDFQPVG